MAKFLVTGATGFVGNAVARQLLKAGHEVRAVSRAQSDRTNLQGLDLETVTADLGQAETLKGISRGCDGLFHVAADYRLWVPKPEAMYRANVDGSRALIKAALDEGVERIVYTSSVATLKVSAGPEQSDESSIATLDDMVGHYKRSKYLAEQAIKEEIAAGAPIVFASPTAPIGPRDIKPTPTGKMIVDAANGRMPAYLDTGLNVVHVDDVAHGHILAYECGKPGENYILGSEDLLLKDILAIVAKFMGRKAPKIQLSPALVKPIAHLSEGFARLFGGEAAVPVDAVRMAEKKMFFSCDKASKELGYMPGTAKQAISDALDWFIEKNYVINKKININ